jgi:hypothetical protein
MIAEKGFAVPAAFISTAVRTDRMMTLLHASFT